MKTIALTKGYVAVVDEEDFERVSAHKWYASIEGYGGAKVYAKRRRKTTDDPRWKSDSIRMHHFILDKTPHEIGEGRIVDHKNHDGLDNQKSNLEVISQTENMLRSRGWKRKKEEPFL